MSGDGRGDNSTKAVLIIVGAILGAVLLVVLVCGGLTFLGIRAMTNTFGGVMATMQAMVADMQEAQAAATTFFNDLAANRPDQAYAATSRAFQGRQTQDEFRAFVEQNPQLKRVPVAQPIALQTGPGSRFTYQYPLGAPGQGTCTVQVVKEDGHWRVDMLTIP
jgi:hypothetical protein